MKFLKEKRVKLIEQIDGFATLVETEQRALNTDEQTELAKVSKEIADIDATIEGIKDAREERAKSTEEVQELKEERSMEEVEKRALDAFFRGNMNQEERAMLTTNNGTQATIPVTIANGILKKLEEMCPVLEKSRRFSTKGTLRLINETSYGTAGITGESENFADADATLNHIELKSFKITSQVKASFELLANSEVDINAYLTDVIVRRLAKEVNKHLISSTNKSVAPEGLINGTQICEVGTELSIQDFIMMQTTMHPAYLDKAFWVMNRKTFQGVAKLMDNMGRPYMTSNVIGEKIQYRLLGLPIVVDMHMPDATADGKAVILANVEEGYAVNLLQNVTVRHLTEIGFTEGTETFAGYLMLDGRIVNQDCIVVGQCKDAVGASVAKAKK